MKFEIGQLVYHLPALESATWGLSVARPFLVLCKVETTDEGGTTRSYVCESTTGVKEFPEVSLVSADDPVVEQYRERAFRGWREKMRAGIGYEGFGDQE